MGETQNESRLLVFLLPALLIPIGLALGSGDSSTQWSFLIIAAPMVSFPIILIVGQVWNAHPFWKNTLKEGGIPALMTMTVTLGVGLWVLIDHLCGSAQLSSDTAVNLLSWLSFDVLAHTEAGWMLVPGFEDITFGVWVDQITLMLLFVATFLTFLICWFAIGYMTTDEINENRNHRFFAEYLLFTAGMFGMVLADNFLWLFIFWEIMGLCSYLLIGFYYWKPSAASAAKKAFMTTRVGDVFLMVGLLILYRIYGSLNFGVVFDDPSTGVNGVPVDVELLGWALVMLFIGAVGKSAQFPLHVWLPDAMEGPTPVSALIHAATMVNAGLYLVARMVPFFDVAHGGLAGLENIGILIAWVGGITAFMAAGIAFVQNDIKKVLAYSTMSQLAYIFTGLGAALWFLNQEGDAMHTAGIFVLGSSLFHLFNHAMAKGMLFMASGSVIHEVHHAHDHLHHDDHDHDDDDDLGEVPMALVALVKHLRSEGLTLREFFAALDVDDSRTLDIEELRSGLMGVGIVEEESAIDAMIAAMDRNNDGQIDPIELDSYMMDFLIGGRVESHGGHDNFDPQDMRNMGGLAAHLPVTSTAMMLGSMSIIGIPLIGGFWSKEGIVGYTWKAFFENEPLMLGPALLVLMTAGMTGFYMTRMWMMTFAGAPKSDVVDHVHESTPWIKTPLVTLSIVTAFTGLLLTMFGVVKYLGGKYDELKLYDSNNYDPSAIDAFVYALEHAFLPSDPNMMAVGYTTIVLAFLLGPWLAMRVHGGSLKEGAEAIPVVRWLVNLSGKPSRMDTSKMASSSLAQALENRLYIDDLYDEIIRRTVLPFSCFSAWFDKRVIDGIVKGVERGSQGASQRIRLLTTGSARDYILYAAVGALSITFI
ncbi:MAG: proton-conducting transporter membrane subunit, partial [Candidatus Thermoplasmatota archaeon]|nr:proton-conducting transporter membrane subunit [Candidatus Thermoplasmatota archaeon]